MDLCSKDNGNTHKSFGLYTFIKVSVTWTLNTYVHQTIYLYYHYKFYSTRKTFHPT